MVPSRLLAADKPSGSELHAATVAAFSDYLAGPFQMTLEQFPSFIGRHGVDLARSRVAMHEGVIAAFAFVCPRPEVDRWRLGAMGALPAVRGNGMGPALLDDFVARARAEGVPWLELECFAGNERALRLYRSRGFKVVSSLNGWKAPDERAAASARGVRPVDRAVAFEWLAAAEQRVAWMPFQNTKRCLATQPRTLTFWQCGSAQLAFSVVEGTPTQIHSLIDLHPALHDAEVLARAVAAAHPGAYAAPILRDDLGGWALQHAGFVPQQPSQVLMSLALQP